MPNGKGSAIAGERCRGARRMSRILKKLTGRADTSPESAGSDNPEAGMCWGAASPRAFCKNPAGSMKAPDCKLQSGAFLVYDAGGRDDPP
jgi:hypothetical protein